MGFVTFLMICAVTIYVAFLQKWSVEGKFQKWYHYIWQFFVLWWLINIYSFSLLG